MLYVTPKSKVKIHTATMDDLNLEFEFNHGHGWLHRIYVVTSLDMKMSIVVLSMAKLPSEKKRPCQSVLMHEGPRGGYT